MIEYTVRDLVKILMRNWYIIVIISVVFAIISFPLSKISYVQNVKNYNDFVDKNINAEVEINSFAIDISLKDNENITNKEIAHDLKQICKETTGYNQNAIQMMYYYSIHQFVITNIKMSEEAFATYIVNVKNNLQGILGEAIDLKYNEIEKVQMKEDEMVGFDNSIYRQPTQFNYSIKTILKSAIFGFLVGIILTLIIDFIKITRKTSKQSK